VDQLHAFSFPVGILTVNIIGSFLMGFLAWTFTSHITLAEEHRAAILVGLLGGFTTFSTFSHDTLQHFVQGQYTAVMLNIVLSVVLCIIAAGAGLLLAKSLLT
jgi:CrcB protein